jgi:hypothetical protein
MGGDGAWAENGAQAMPGAQTSPPMMAHRP